LVLTYSRALFQDSLLLLAFLVQVAAFETSLPECLLIGLAKPVYEFLKPFFHITTSAKIILPYCGENMEIFLTI